MRILFDHQVFSWQTYGGISRYFVEQIRELALLQQEPLLPESFFSENIYLQQLPDFQRDSLTSFSFKGKKILQNLLGRQHSKKALDFCHPDVFHPTYFDPYFLKKVQKKGIPFVLTVHDMIHEIYGHGSKGMFSLDAQVLENKRILSEKADAIITVSEHTRLDLMRFYPHLDPAKIHVVHHGNALASTRQERPAVPYLLFVGQRKAYKNFSWMLEYLADLIRSEKDLQLICVGGSGFDPVETEQIERLGVAHKVHYKTVRSDKELSGLYSQATCFIFPSRYEGFGMPVLEAFACGCPAVLNQASSLPEVGGDAAIYFEENNPESLEVAVRRVLDDSFFRNVLVEKGRARAAQFSWAQSAAKHLKVYQSVAQ